MKLYKRSFIVTVETTMSAADTAEYVYDAIKSWGGQYFPGDLDEPEDPRRDLIDHEVTVKQYRKQRKAREPKP